MAKTTRSDGKSLAFPLLVLGAAALLGMYGCSAEIRGGSKSGRPGSSEAPLSLIWISIDTLRADHLGLYGYDRDTSPFLDELGRRGLTFEWTVSPQQSTLPTHLTMFSGYHPAVHQVMDSKSLNPGVRLSESVRTLPEVLREAGYVTRAWVDGGRMSGHYGFERGFDLYDDEPTFLPAKLAQVLEHLDGQKTDRPFFYFIHTYQVHRPYPAPSGYDDRFVTQGERTEAQATMDLYDGCIRFVDDQLRGFVAELEKRGFLEFAILTITGDHGENFNDYGMEEIGHRGPNMRQNITRVPWLVLHPDPSLRRRKVNALTGLIDFPNTMLALLGFEERLPGGGVDVLGSETDGAREYLSWRKNGWSVYSGEHHVLASDQLPGADSNAVYRFRDDPLETTRIEDPQVVDPLRTRLFELRDELKVQARGLTGQLRDFGAEPKDTRTLRKQLKALGYIE